ncbi:Porphobilinogen deaminase [Bienertia sinuspersici]
MNSPRLSFSRDLGENESTTNSFNDFTCAFDSTFDFAFSVDKSVLFASSSADELFSDGKIIPTCLKTEEIKVSQQKPIRPCLDFQPKIVTEERKKSLKEFLEDSIEEEEEDPNSAFVTKSFWKFRRSNSLNCDSNQRKGLIGSWKILSRSGSTGKFLEKIVEEEKPSYNFHQKLLSKFSRNNSLNNAENVIISSNNKGLIGSSSSSKILRRSHSTSDHYLDQSKSNSNHFRRSNSTGSALKKQQSQKQQRQVVSCQKGKAKDNNNIRGYGSHYNYNNNNSSKLSPMLNLPSPFISRVSVDLLSFGSLFCNGNKDRKKRK